MGGGGDFVEEICRAHPGAALSPFFVTVPSEIILNDIYSAAKPKNKKKKKVIKKARKMAETKIKTAAVEAAKGGKSRCYRKQAAKAIKKEVKKLAKLGGKKEAARAL